MQIGMIFVEEGVALNRKHPHPSLETVPALREGRKRGHQTGLDLFDEGQDIRKLAWIHVVDQLEENPVYLGAKDNCCWLHRRSLGHTGLRAGAQGVKIPFIGKLPPALGDIGARLFKARVDPDLRHDGVDDILLT